MRKIDIELNSFFQNIFERASLLYERQEDFFFRPVLVHTSLSSFPKGWKNPKKVLRAIFQQCKKNSLTLVMCAHQDYLSYKKEMRSSSIPCISMGIVPETFRKQFFTKRSMHPLYSFCARGPLAFALLKDHTTTAALGFDSPLGKLWKEDALIVMLGTDWTTCSIMHLAEYAFETQARKSGKGGEYVTNVCYVQREKIQWSDIRFNTEIFTKIGEAFMSEKKDRYIQGFIDSSRHTEFKCFRARDLISFSIDRYATFQ